MAAGSAPFPLYDRIPRRNTIPRVVELTILFLLFCLLIYRVVHLQEHGFPWLLALVCESWFTFVWVLVVSSKWNQVDYETYPDRLLEWKTELPPVDMFVTTADAELEPPILTVNTVLSLLSVDYPADKLACYVSDDGCSPLIYYSLVEASQFAKLWVPFCKKYNVKVRAPFRYFSSEHSVPSTDRHVSPQFQEEWKRIKDVYEKLSRKIEDAARNSAALFELKDEYAAFFNGERGNHPTIIKVIWENKGATDPSSGVPHIIYLSREKRPKHPHNFKAGAMNVLTRVSGVMTNAPFMLNVDCDQFVNNPRIVLHAMCLLLGINNESDCAFVQSPQKFYDGNKDDPFGNQLVVTHQYLGSGIAGIQGPFYQGTGCFHRRKVIYGLYPEDNDTCGKISDLDLHKTLGNSAKLIKGAAVILSGKSSGADPHDLEGSADAALQVAGCGYEFGTLWGSKVGWIYGSATEDVLTGLTIHAEGWRSVLCTPDPPAFLGCAPPGGPPSMTQMKRWATGLLQILFSGKSPLILVLRSKLQFRQALAYLWVMVWGLRSIFELCYAVLPAYCIITNAHFLPKVGEEGFLIPLAIFFIYNVYTLSEYIRTGLSIQAWWNNQRMWRVTAITAFLFGSLSVIPKLLGLSETAFEVTKKEQGSLDSKDDGDNNHDKNIDRFMFDESPIFISGTSVLFIQLTAMVARIFGYWPPSAAEEEGWGMGEVVCSMWVVMCFWVFLKGLFGKGKYGIPLSIIVKAGALALLFVHWCRYTITSRG